MPFKILPRALLCLPLLFPSFAPAQCPLVANNTYQESSATNYNWMFHWGLCEGPGCPWGNYLYIALGRGNPCPDEPATVWMSRNVQPSPRQGIIINYTVRGERSGYLYRFGYDGVDCDGVSDVYETAPYNCLPCDAYFWSECSDTGTTRAECSASTPCTASCATSTASVTLIVWDNCVYKSSLSHWCEARAYSTGGGVNTAGSYAEGAIYYDGYPRCSGYETSKCNGYYSNDFHTCGCPEDGDQF